MKKQKTRKKASHKYISRSYKNGKWIYEYQDPKKEKMQSRSAQNARNQEAIKKSVKKAYKIASSEKTKQKVKEAYKKAPKIIKKPVATIKAIVDWVTKQTASIPKHYNKKISEIKKSTQDLGKKYVEKNVKQPVKKVQPKSAPKTQKKIKSISKNVQQVGKDYYKLKKRTFKGISTYNRAVYNAGKAFIDTYKKSKI